MTVTIVKKIIYMEGGRTKSGREWMNVSVEGDEEVRKSLERSGFKITRPFADNEENKNLLRCYMDNLDDFTITHQSADKITVQAASGEKSIYIEEE